MGNKNARSKKLSDLPNLNLPSSFTADKNSEINTFAITSPKSPLAFKSFRQGTLITPNFEVLGKPGAKSLSATSAEFVPACPLKVMPFPKVAHHMSDAPTIEKLQHQTGIVHGAQLTATPGHIYTEVGGFENACKFAMEKELGAIPTNRIQPNSAGSHGANQILAIHPLQDGMNAMSISSVNSKSQKVGTSNFATPIKPNQTSHSASSPIPTGPRPLKPRFGRSDKKKKDIIITQFGIIRNIARITECFTDNGFPYKHVCDDEFRPEVYDVADIVRKMPLEERKEFWSKNWIDIEVDLRSDEEIFGINPQADGPELAPRDYDTLLHYIDYLGPDFAAHAKYIFVSIMFPSIPDADQSKVDLSVLHSQHTPEFQHLERLVAKLQPFPNIKRFEIILQTPSNSKKPLSIPQLNLILPFYDLGFTDWNIKWKTGFMTKPEPVGGWPIHYLDKERNRILWERERVKNAVFVRKSEFVR
ncbi:hypothetical protein DSL72_005331 [Monilinia vaccinii-corymbosi]|uniref:Uncharacterized protein n=1 Tax=Monilinia vaccinii-corymbosi TaxID=61207 RepID=A0A8A3PFA0_9HELO|nr:hypothetical protein DSL72_005331 [Monilinia vaccinii-corymbosi]